MKILKYILALMLMLPFLHLATMMKWVIPMLVLRIL